MVVPNVDNISIGNFQGIDIERAPTTIEESLLTRATNFVVRGGDLVKRPPFRQAVNKLFEERTDAVSQYEYAPTRALPSVAGEMVCVGPVLNAGVTKYEMRIYPTRGNNSPTYASIPNIAAMTNRCAQGADFVTCAKVGSDYYFGGPAGLWKFTPPGTWVQVVLPDASAGVRQAIYFKNRLWVVADGWTGTTPAPDLRGRLYYSNPAAPSVIGSTINIAFNESLGDLKCVIPYSDRIICFTDRSIWNLYLSGDVASWSQRLFLRGVGAHNPQSVVEYNGMIYFLNSQGLWKTDGNVLEEISAPIRKWIVSEGAYEGSFQFFENSIALYKDFLVVRVNRNDPLAVYSMFLFNLEWNAWSGVTVNDALNNLDGFRNSLNNYMWSVQDQTGQRFLFCGTNGKHMVDFGDPAPYATPVGFYQDLRQKDGQVAIHVSYYTEFRTKHFDAGKMPRLKDVVCAQVEFRGTESGGPASVHVIEGWWYVDSNMADAVNLRTYTGAETVILNSYMYSFPGARYARRFSFHVRESSDGFVKVLETNLEVLAKRDDPKNPSV